MRPVVLIPLVIAAIVAVLFTVVLVQQIQDNDDPARDFGRPSVLIGKPVPQFNAPLLSQPNQRFNQKLLANQVVVVNFWGTWCPECFAEHEVLTELAAQVPVYGFNFKDKLDVALAWLDKHGNPFRESYFDPNGEIYLKWGVSGAPETFVIDANGIIQFKFSGQLTRAVVEQKIMPLVNQLRGVSLSDNTDQEPQ